MKLTREMKKTVKEERAKLLEMMRDPNITTEDWKELNNKYQAYTEMLKPSWKVSPDVIVSGIFSLGGILAILNFEKMDIVRSKAMSFVFRGRL